MKHICYIVHPRVLNFAANKNKNDMHKPNNYKNDITARDLLRILPHKARELI